jgi:hypothetical protein
LPRNVLLKLLDQIHIQRGACVDAVDSHRFEQPIGKMRERVRGGAIGRHALSH